MRTPQVISCNMKMEAVISFKILLHWTTRRHVPQYLAWIDHQLEQLCVTLAFLKRQWSSVEIVAFNNIASVNARCVIQFAGKWFLTCMTASFHCRVCVTEKCLTGLVRFQDFEVNGRTGRQKPYVRGNWIQVVTSTASLVRRRLPRNTNP
jgi:hypothetical protein